jgi:hypothetical protein
MLHFFQRKFKNCIIAGRFLEQMPFLTKCPLHHLVTQSAECEECLFCLQNYPPVCEVVCFLSMGTTQNISRAIFSYL